MPVEQHKKAAESLKKAADLHEKASNEYKSGNADKGASYAQSARGHKEEGTIAANDASMEHAKKYGSK